MTTVQVMLGERSYPVRIRAGGLAEMAESAASELGMERVVVITTPRVGKAWFDTLAAGLERAQVELMRLEVPDGERAKTMRTASRIYDQLLDLAVDRQTFMLGLGGGAACDLTGYVASTWLRGVPLLQVPTTLLAQVDASVGGKTAVNHPRGKNLIGTFYQPRQVWVDPEVLRTLPRREFRCGLAEVIKAGALWDAEFFAWLEQEIEAVSAREPEALARAITRAIEIKAEVVSLDEREGGLRALLNFGHTLAHAIENVAGYRRVRHGEAVAMGMVFACRLSERRGRIGPDVTARVEDLLVRAGLQTTPPDWSGQRDAYLRAIAVDKKVAGGKVGFVVLDELGRAEVLQLTPQEILE
ncbi:MAG: 3-dehydroquinate synthase, partial [Deltaproteobacteria bacterium]|nr:3-dehydroquinate synthase [Deltaproteobacteria bacterium]